MYDHPSEVPPILYIPTRHHAPPATAHCALHTRNSRAKHRKRRGHGPPQDGGPPDSFRRRSAGETGARPCTPCAIAGLADDGWIDGWMGEHNIGQSTRPGRWWFRSLCGPWHECGRVWCARGRRPVSGRKTERAAKGCRVCDPAAGRAGARERWGFSPSGGRTDWDPIPQIFGAANQCRLAFQARDDRSGGLVPLNPWPGMQPGYEGHIL